MCIVCIYNRYIYFKVTEMNLRAAQKELGGRTPEVTAPVLALETLVVVGVSFLLVGLFA